MIPHSEKKRVLGKSKSKNLYTSAPKKKKRLLTKIESEQPMQQKKPVAYCCCVVDAQNKQWKLKKTKKEKRKILTIWVNDSVNKIGRKLLIKPLL